MWSALKACQLTREEKSRADYELPIRVSAHASADLSVASLDSEVMQCCFLSVKASLILLKKSVYLSGNLSA